MNEILKQLELISGRGYSSHTIFTDFIDLILFALQEDNERYLEIVHKYKNDKPLGHREIDFFHMAFQLLQYEMRETNSDVLGELYMNWNLSNKLKGQFFTPKNVASMMAQINNPMGFIIDPCCGSGVMLVECIKVMTQEKLDKSIFFGQDIDMTCVKMTALNLCFFNVHGYVIQGDSLGFECNKVFKTNRSLLGGSIFELREKELEDFKSWYFPAVKISMKETSEIKKQNEDQFSLSFSG